MNEEDFMYWLRSVIIAMLIVFLIVGATLGLSRAFNTGREKACEKLGEQIGYNTKVVFGECRIEIRPHLWIGEHELTKILFLIDCEKGKE